MTKQDYTALVFVVDRSGSMMPIAHTMEAAVEEMIAEQAKLPGKLTVDYVRFDTEIEHILKAAEPSEVSISIDPRGGTALYDAVATTIDNVGSRLSKTPDDERPDRVIVAIVTDGWENASRRFNVNDVKSRIEHQTSKYGWDFVYLGANQDAVLTAGAMGIGAGSALTYDTHNTAVALAAASSYVTATRSGLTASFTDEDRNNAV